MIRLLAWLAVGLVAAVVVPSAIASAYYLDVLSTAAVLAILALSVAVVFGRLGYPTFGHAAFFGLGAYFIGLLVALAGLNFWMIVPLAIVPGAILGVLVGFAAARLAGAYFAISTLVVAQLLGLVASDWQDLTRGPMGTMVNAGAPPWRGLFGWSSLQAYLALLIVALTITIVLVRNLFRSPVGRAWIAIREAPDLAEAIGIASKRLRVVNVTISGAIAALAGALFVPKIFVISPDLFGINYSATAILAVILGGKATVLGPVIGGFIFAILPEAFRPLGDWNFGAFALIMLISVLMLPGGLVSIPERLGWRRARPARTRTDLPDPAPLALRTAGTPGSPALVAHSVTKSFGGVRAVQDISLTVAAGEIVGLIGPNGAGKTTLFNMLTGFQSIDAGRVAAFGTDVVALPSHRIAELGLVRTFQQTALMGPQTVLENALAGAHLVEPSSFWASLIRTPGHLRRETRRLAIALGCLREVGLMDRLDETAGSLPYGEQKLLGVAVALAASPRILLLDEPAAGLNPAEAQRLATALSDLRKKGLTLVVVDHNLPMLMTIADRIVVIHHGVKIAEGTPADITANREVVAAYLGEVELTPPAPVAEPAS